MQNPKENYLPGNIYTSPFKGHQLAIKPPRESVGAIQPDAGIGQAWQNKYATDVAQLMAPARVVTTGFKTIPNA
ncbi:hexameric tyrosine-coordinated heme protein [Adhaeribacter aerolatus]|nr:hexameric tyrosine-coordinated heme protein [Adhaeribacter aerolatus]